MRWASRLSNIVMLLASLLLAGSCSTPGDLRPFEATGPVWPEAPDQARVQFIGEFGGADDLGIRESFWDKMVNLWAGASARSLARPMAVAVTVDGRIIFVADPDAQCLHRYDLRRGRYDCLAGQDGRMLPSPVGVTVTDSGRVFVTDSSLGQVLTMQRDGDELAALSLDMPLQQPTGIIWDAQSGDLFVADTAAQVIRRFTVDGRQIEELGAHGEAIGRFNFPTYLWPYGGGLLVTDSLNFRVQTFDASGQAVHAFGELGDAPGNLSRPKGVAVDSQGHIYVVDALFHALQIFDQDGRLLLVLGEQGQAPGQFWLPNGIFIGKDNMIFVADSYNRRIQVFRYIGGDT
jgi:sugar lactone lactonase YvrE